MMQIIIHGRIGRDPKEIQTKTGTVMAVASVVVNLPIVRSDETEAVWLNLLAFGKVAESLLRHKQGDMVNVAGNVQMSQWTDANGELHSQWQVTADSLISARTTRPSGGRKAKPNGQSNDRHAAAERFQGGAEFNDDLRF